MRASILSSSALGLLLFLPSALAFSPSALGPQPLSALRCLNGQFSASAPQLLSHSAPRPLRSRGSSAPHPLGLKMQFGLGNLFGGGGAKQEPPEESGVVPDVIPESFEPKSELRVKFPTWVKAPVDLSSVASFGGTPTRGAGEISCGQTITPTQAQDRPTLGWEAEPGAYYTVILTDPDVPSRAEPKMREWVHWVRVNVPGDNLPCDGQDGGEELKVYVGAGPPMGTGEHRYVFLVYKQPDGKMEFDKKEEIPFVADGRNNWSASKFAEEYNLGSPIAWTYFKAQYDLYVPELVARLKGEIKD